MYSLTETGIHQMGGVDPTMPQVRIRCKCSRTFIQEEIFTCLACAHYCCQYCTTPYFSMYQCRSCKKIYEGPLRSNKCASCSSCPCCQTVLNVATDPHSRRFVLLCQFCHWSSKEVGIAEDSVDALLENVSRHSNAMKDVETKMYNIVWAHFKEENLAYEMQNQAYKHITSRANMRRLPENPSRLHSPSGDAKGVIKHTSLEEDSEEFSSAEGKFPQGLPLVMRRIRRCPNCSKPLTSLYRPVRSNDLKVEPTYKDFKVLQVQRYPSTNNSVKIRFLRNTVYKGTSYQNGDIETVPVAKPFIVLVLIENKTTTTVIYVTYTFIIEVPIIRKN